MLTLADGTQVRSNLSKFSEDGCPGTEPKRGNLLAIAPLAQALAMSLQAAGVPTSLESQDPALVRNILRTLSGSRCRYVCLHVLCAHVLGSGWWPLKTVRPVVWMHPRQSF